MTLRFCERVCVKQDEDTFLLKDDRMRSQGSLEVAIRKGTDLQVQGKREEGYSNSVT